MCVIERHVPQCPTAGTCPTVSATSADLVTVVLLPGSTSSTPVTYTIVGRDYDGLDVSRGGATFAAIATSDEHSVTPPLTFRGSGRYELVVAPGYLGRYTLSVTLPVKYDNTTCESDGNRTICTGSEVLIDEQLPDTPQIEVVCSPGAAEIFENGRPTGSCGCLPGTEVLSNGSCVPCPIGTFKETVQGACQNCPRQFETTPWLGASSATSCVCQVPRPFPHTAPGALRPFLSVRVC